MNNLVIQMIGNGMTMNLQYQQFHLNGILIYGVKVINN